MAECEHTLTVDQLRALGKRRERPLPLSTDMVRATLCGDKTQTRRVIVPQPPEDATEVFFWSAPEIPERSKASEGIWYRTPRGLHFLCRSRWGHVGDRLWVKETFFDTEGEWNPSVVYKADGVQLLPGWRWTSGRFMPRRASRILLEVTGLGAQRVQDISEEDAIAEGLARSAETGRYLPGPCDYARWAYEILWDRLNAKRGYPWGANPWVWVIDFKRVEPTSPLAQDVGHLAERVSDLSARLKQ